MNQIREMPTTQIKQGIIRCEARLTGVMPMGLLTEQRVKDALRQYRTELERRGITELSFFINGEND